MRNKLLHGYESWFRALEACKTTNATRVIKASQVVVESPRHIDPLFSLSNNSRVECLPTTGTGIMCGRTDFCPIR